MISLVSDCASMTKGELLQQLIKKAKLEAQESLCQFEWSSWDLQDTRKR